MIFKEWFEMFYNAYCVDVIAYDCYKDYYYINQKHFGYIADMELKRSSLLIFRIVLNPPYFTVMTAKDVHIFYLNVYSVKL